MSAIFEDFVIEQLLDATEEVSECKNDKNLFYSDELQVNERLGLLTVKTIEVDWNQNKKLLNLIFNINIKYAHLEKSTTALRPILSLTNVTNIITDGRNAVATL